MYSYEIGILVNTWRFIFGAGTAYVVKIQFTTVRRSFLILAAQRQV